MVVSDHRGGLVAPVGVFFDGGSATAGVGWWRRLASFLMVVSDHRGGLVAPVGVFFDGQRDKKEAPLRRPLSFQTVFRYSDQSHQAKSSGLSRCSWNTTLIGR